MIASLLRFVKEHKLRFAGAILLGVATIIAGIGLMSTSGLLISRAALRPMIVDLFMITAAVRFFGISRAVLRYFERLVSHDMVFRILLAMRSQLYQKLDTLPLAWLMGRRPGDLLSRFVSDIETLQNTYLRIISPAIVAAMVTVITCFALWLFDPILSLVALLFLFTGGVAIPLLAVYLAREAGRSEIRLKAGLRSYLVDRLQGLADVFWLGQIKTSEAAVKKTQEQITGFQSRNAGITGILEGANSLVANAGMLIVLILSVPQVLSGEIRGVFLAMLTLGVLSSFEAVQSLATAFLHYAGAKEAARRYFAVTPRNEPSRQDKTDNLPHNPDIAFRNVSFSYSDENITLKNISFSIPYSSRVAIVGPTGSGKSTLINLLLRLWEIDSGVITLSNTDVRLFNTDKLRAIYSVVAQDAYLFNRSLRENLLIADPTATDEHLLKVLAMTGLNFDAQDLSVGAGNHGSRFSGGERQLISIARALLKNSPVLIFDEPSANLDVATERRIMDVIWRVAANRTVIFITHRLVDMEKMDQIMVLQHGSIIGQGTHNWLIMNNKIYARMCEEHKQLIRE